MFPVGEFFSPTGNLVLGGIRIFNAQSSISPFYGIRKAAKDKVKRFYKRLPYSMTKFLLRVVKALQYHLGILINGTVVPANWY